MKVSELLDPSSILLQFEAKNKEDALRQLAEKFSKCHRGMESRLLFSTLLKREELGSTGIGRGVAIPHTRSGQVKKPTGLLAISKNGVNFNSLDGELVYIFFLVVYPENSVGVHLLTLSNIARLLRDNFVRNLIRKADSAVQVIRIIGKQETQIKVSIEMAKTS